MSDPRTLLIVDDCAEDRKVYRRYLAKDPHQSYEIREANCAENGLALYQECRSDVVLLDFCLPDMTGLEFLEHLQQQRLDFPLPVIMLTGQGDEAIAVQAMKRGAQDYLVKNFLKADVLQLAVRNVIRQSYLQAQLSKTQERQQLTAMTALQIRQSLDLEKILHTATVELRRLLQCDRVVVYQLGADQNGKIVAESVAAGWTSALGITIPDSFLHQPHHSMVAEQYPRTMSNIEEASLSACHLRLLQQFEVRANLAVPILLHTQSETNPKLWGLLIAHQCSSTRQWQPDEVGLFSELSVQIAIAIQQAEFVAKTQAALAKEKDLNLFKSQIIATVSHEYRTPLASILAAASTLEQHRTHLDVLKQQKFLQLIQQKARHLSGLVDDMLLVKQLELDKTQLTRLPLDLVQFMEALVQEQQEIAGDRYTLSTKISGNPNHFLGNRGLLHQIFVNLISNAIKYSPKGGSIVCHLREEETQVVFAVKDKGIGIPLEDQPKLFQVFSRGSNVDTIPGTGLGLAIVKACVDLHDGHIALDSDLRKGTTVTITLPKHPLQGQAETTVTYSTRLPRTLRKSVS
jgi:signal transduction histidine kinase/DNA-binding NarL/FixJ family response regulator